MSNNQISLFFSILSDLEKPLKKFCSLCFPSIKIPQYENPDFALENKEKTNEIVETYETLLKGFQYEKLNNEEKSGKYRIINNFNEGKIKIEGFL